MVGLAGGIVTGFKDDYTVNVLKEVEQEKETYETEEYEIVDSEKQKVHDSTEIAIKDFEAKLKEVDQKKAELKSEVDRCNRIIKYLLKKIDSDSMSKNSSSKKLTDYITTQKMAINSDTQLDPKEQKLRIDEADQALKLFEQRETIMNEANNEQGSLTSDDEIVLKRLTNDMLKNEDKKLKHQKEVFEGIKPCIINT